MVGSRIRHGAAADGSDLFGGWTHVVNLIVLGGQRFLLDGGFGPQGPVRPVLLTPDGAVHTQIAPAQLRLRRDAMQQNLDDAQRVWVYQHRTDDAAEWKTMYCFVDLEFTPADVAAMNFAPALSRQTFFTHKVVANRFTVAGEVGAEDERGPGSPPEDRLEGEIDGALTLNQETLKWRRRGVKVLDVRFKNEEERIHALRKYFGIALSHEEREAIDGTAAMIGARAMGADD